MYDNGYYSVEDIEQYTLPFLVIRPKVVRAYFEKNFDQYYEEYASAKNPRLVAHILVSMENPFQPSEEEYAKIKVIEEALLTRDFGEVAKDYSDDTGSAQENGFLGVIDQDNRSNYVSEFAGFAMLLEEDEVSEWVITQFGWHLIINLGSSKERLQSSDDFYSRLAMHYYSITDRIVYEKALEIGVNFFGNDTLQKYLMDSMGVSE